VNGGQHACVVPGASSAIKLSMVSMIYLLVCKMVSLTAWNGIRDGAIRNCVDVAVIALNTTESLAQDLLTLWESNLGIAWYA
jgi:hypothetical protein